jgi:hypothetical protein
MGVDQGFLKITLLQKKIQNKVKVDCDCMITRIIKSLVNVFALKLLYLEFAAKYSMNARSRKFQ